MGVAPTRYHCEMAYLGGEKATPDVVVEVVSGQIASVEVGAAPPPGARRLRGLTLPGFANAHSHAFHRVLRARTERAGTFWSWREVMYAVAAALTPERYHRLARAVFAEMVEAGFSCVGEFHYLHHAPGGAPYDEENEMGAALVEAAQAAGIKMTLVDACYLEGAPGAPATGTQRRFSDGDVTGFLVRAERLARDLGLGLAPAPGSPSRGEHAGVRMGLAAHSLRAVEPKDVGEIASAARRLGVPFHVHVSEQPAENDAVRAAYGASPVEVLAECGALGPTTTAVHATQVDERSRALLGTSGATVCMCPTTERALGDGLGPIGELAGLGCGVAIGSDSQAVVDPLEEVRALELDERLRTGRRGCFTSEELVVAGTAAGHAALGWPEAGRIAPGAPADLVTVALSSVRLAGWDAERALEQVIFSGGAADVTDVVVSGRLVVEDGHHVAVDDVAGELARAISEVLAAVEEHAGG